MKAAVMYEAGDVRVEERPDPTIQKPTDALVRVTHGCICGSDLWPYKSMKAKNGPRPMGHEFIGVVEDAGSDVSGLSKGDLVVAPFLYSDNTCEFCRDGFHTSCVNGGGWGEETGGGQGEAVRVPQAAGTLVKLPVEPDSALMPSLLTLSDVFCTGHHAAVMAGVREGDTVTVIGDGAVGLSAVLAAKRLGAEQIILMGHHESRTDLGREFGATDVVAERGDEGAEKARDLAKGTGTRTVLECVGTIEAVQMGVDVVRDGGVISRVGAAQYSDVPFGFDTMMRNLTLTGGIAPARAYIEDLLPDILDGTIEPGRVFDRTVDLDGVPDGYRAMNDREALKVLVTP